MSNNTASHITAVVQHGMKGLNVDGVFHPVKGCNTLVWEGVSKSGRFFLSLAHSTMQDQFTLVASTPDNPCGFISHPMLWRNGSPIGHKWETAVSMLRHYQSL